MFVSLVADGADEYLGNKNLNDRREHEIYHGVMSYLGLCTTLEFFPTLLVALKSYYYLVENFEFSLPPILFSRFLTAGNAFLLAR